MLPHIPSEAHERISKKKYGYRVSKPIMSKIAHFYKAYCVPKQAANIIGVSHGIIDSRVDTNPKYWKMPGRIPASKHPLGENAHENTKAFVAIELVHLIAEEIESEKKTKERKLMPAIVIDECVERAKRKYYEKLEIRDKIKREIKLDKTYVETELFGLCKLDSSNFSKGRELLMDEGWATDDIYTTNHRVKGSAILEILKLLEMH